MQRETVEDIVRSMYSARLANCVDECVSYFSSNAEFKLVGEEKLNPQPEQPLSNDVKQKIANLVSTWNWVSIDDLRVVVDGNNISCMYTLTTVFNPSGETIVTTLADHIVMDDDGKISELVEFVDTGMIQSLIAAL